MRYCKKCLQPDTRPGILFDEQQVCYACRYEESKALIDWYKRNAELQAIAEVAKAESKQRGLSHDCVIGVSGGKDSTFQALYAKEKLGLRPLLINCAPIELTEAGKRNIDNLNSLGFDIITIRPNTQIVRRLTRKSFIEYGNITKASEYCLWASAYIMADRFDIPLVIQGENPALTLGVAAKQDISDDAFGIVDSNTIAGCNAVDLIRGEKDISLQDVFFYQMPDIASMRRKNIRAVFLQYYVPGWSPVNNALFSIARGLMGRTTEDLHDLGFYYRYSSVDSDFLIPNQMIKYYKFGFGMATDQACYDIREGRLTREEAIWRVKEYDGKCGQQYIAAACRYMSLTEGEFWETVNRFVNKKLFYQDFSGRWLPKFTVGDDYKEG